MKTKHEITFDLHLSRFYFVKVGLQFIWAGIIGRKAVLIKNAGCDQITADGKAL